MKKIIALFSSLLIFAGVKAQTTSARKETVKPSSPKPATSNLIILHKVTDKGAPTQKIIKDAQVTSGGIKETPAIKGAPVGSKGTPITIKGAPATLKGETPTLKVVPPSKEAPAAKSSNR